MPLICPARYSPRIDFTSSVCSSSRGSIASYSMAYPGRIISACSRPGNGSDHGLLHVDRHAGGHAVDVDLVGVQPLRLEKDLVTRLVRELHHLVFDGGAVARPDAFDLAAVERRARDGVRAARAGSRRWCSRCGRPPAAGRSSRSETKTAWDRHRRAAARSVPSRWCGRPGAAAFRSSAASSSSPGCAAARPADCDGASPFRPQV